MGLSEKKWIWKDGYQYRSTPLLEISSIDFSRNVFGPKTGFTDGSQQPFRCLDFFNVILNGGQNVMVSLFNNWILVSKYLKILGFKHLKFLTKKVRLKTIQQPISHTDANLGGHYMSIRITFKLSSSFLSDRGHVDFLSDMWKC